MTGHDLPAVNAVLNSTSAVLLVAGLIAIKRRFIVVHKTCMFAALAVSTAFLASYLYYHFVVRNGRPTHFPETGTMLYVYLAILLSHTLLAVVAAPLALITAWLGMKDRLKQHMSLARWTFPIWLYVSITGVVVYVLLYHLYPVPEATP